MKLFALLTFSSMLVVSLGCKKAPSDGQDPDSKPRTEITTPEKTPDRNDEHGDEHGDELVSTSWGPIESFLKPGDIIEWTDENGVKHQHKIGGFARPGGRVLNIDPDPETFKKNK